jgi:hypothetical protein
MRLLGVLILALFMYFAVPLLWQHAMVKKVGEISANGTGIPAGNAIEVNWDASQNLVAGINGPQINEEQMNEFEQVGARAAADDAMRQAQAAQDRAWAATH